MTRRTSVWFGGSSSPSVRSSTGTTTPGALNPWALEKPSVSRNNRRHSPWRVT